MQDKGCGLELGQVSAEDLARIEGSALGAVLRDLMDSGKTLHSAVPQNRSGHMATLRARAQ